jgi:Calcium-activated chloride channel
MDVSRECLPGHSQKIAQLTSEISELTNSVEAAKGSSKVGNPTTLPWTCHNLTRTCHNLTRKAAEEAVTRKSQYLNDARSKCWEEALLRDYWSIGDYTTLVVQLSLVLSFSMVFPLAPLLALLYNLALIRLDAGKLCYTRKRPIAVKTSGIGVWEDVMQITSGNSNNYFFLIYI